SRRDEVAQPCKEHPANEKADTGEYRPCQVERSGESCGSRQQGDRNQRENIGACLPARASPASIDNGKHREPCARIVLAIHPANGIEMRQLPEKNDHEKHHPSERNLSGSRNPAKDRGQGSGNRSHQRTEPCSSLERRIEKQVGKEGNGSERACEVVHPKKEINQPRSGKHKSEG